MPCSRSATSSYPQFCHVGRQVDGKLAALGGRRMLPLAEADVDFETIATPWAAEVLEQTGILLGRPASAVKAAVAHALPSAPEVTRSHPFAAELLVNQRITGRRSDRDVRHMELLTVGSGLSYQPGDFARRLDRAGGPAGRGDPRSSRAGRRCGGRVQRRDDAVVPLAEGAAGADRPDPSVSCGSRRPLPGGAASRGPRTRAP